MTTPKPDPSVVASEKICNYFGVGASFNLKAVEGKCRAAYAEHMKAAEEMAKVLKVRMPLDPEAFAALARWRELNPEVEG